MKEPIQATVELSEAVEIPWHQLKKGSANVRTVKPNNEADAALIANIADIGGARTALFNWVYAKKVIIKG